MPRVIQIRNVPEALHRRLKTRAAMAGMSLSQYLLGEVRALAERPTLDQLRVRLASRPPAAVGLSPTRALRAERGH
jgi:plasmid stability protein